MSVAVKALEPQLMPAQVQPLRWWQLPAVTDLELELFGDEAWPDELFWSELAQPQVRRYWRAVEPGTSPDDSTPGLVGYLGLALEAPGKDAWVQTIAVAPAAQGRGVGTLLLRHLLGTAARRGARQCLLEVRADNPVAQHLYAQHGFVSIHVEKGYYQPSGTDALVMQCDDLTPWLAGPGEAW